MAGYCGDSFYSYLYPTISVASSVPAGTTIPFQLILTDAYSNQFTISLSYALR